MIFLHSVESILTIVVMFMTGFFMSKAGWLDEKASEVFAKIILNVSLPCYMLWNLMSNFDKASLVHLSGGLLVPFLSIGIAYLLSIPVSNLLKVRKERKGVFRSVFFTSNTIFIGLTVNLALFGEKSVPYVLLYYIVNTTFFWTIGVHEIRKDGTRGEKAAFFSKENLAHIVSPALGGFIAAVILIMLRVKLPMFIMDSSKYIGQLTTPLAMLFIGIVLYSVKLREIKIDRDMIVLILARFFICPMLVILITHFIPIPHLMKQVFVIQSAMPAMTSTGVVAKGYHSDYKFGTIVTVVTTILSMIVIPIYMCIV